MLLVCSFFGYPASLTYLITRNDKDLMFLANIYFLNKLQKGKKMKMKKILRATLFVIATVVASAAVSIVLYYILAALKIAS